MICGYIFDLCETPTYTQLTVTAYQALYLNDKPLKAEVDTNDYLDTLYATSNPSTSPNVFQVLFLSDINIDLNYKKDTSSINCYDDACCHDSSPAKGEADKAPIYGSY